MKVEPIGRTISTVIKDLTEKTSNTKQRVIYDALMRKLNKEEKQHVQPGALRRDILTMYIDSPTRMYDFDLRKKRILKELQNELGQDIIKDIKLRIGKIK